MGKNKKVSIFSQVGEKVASVKLSPKSGKLQIITEYGSTTLTLTKKCVSEIWSVSDVSNVSLGGR